MQTETTEATDFDTLTGRQFLTHFFEQAFNGELNILERQMILIFRQGLDQVRFCKTVIHVAHSFLRWY